MLSSSINNEENESQKTKSKFLKSINIAKIKKELKESNEDRNKNEGINRLKVFLKDSIPYAQDATRKQHYKKLLKFIRLVDFLFNESKFNSIINSLQNLDSKFTRLYDAYIYKNSDIPMFIMSIISIGDKLHYNPNIDLIRQQIFDYYIQENIYNIINKKNFIDPQEFPQYMVCFEEVFDVSVDQNGVLNGRVKDDDEYNDIYSHIKLVFDNCVQALDDKVSELTPCLINYNKFNKIDFQKVEEEATHKELNNYLISFKKEDEKVKSIEKKINVGIFEFQLELFIEQISGLPYILLRKLYIIIPRIFLRKVGELNIETDEDFHKINIVVEKDDVESFLKLKKEVDVCSNKKHYLDEKLEEIQELYNIIINYKEIRLEDFERKKYESLISILTRYERRLDSMIYFIDQNIKQYRLILISRIKNYEKMLNKIHDELNEDLINEYNDDTLGALLFLEDKSRRIEKAKENKKIFQQQEIDIEMEEENKSNFENLDLVTYEYELKMNLWKNLKEYQELFQKWKKNKVMEIDLKTMEECLIKWKNNAIVAIKDLDGVDVSKKFLEKINIFEKLLHILQIIQNENIQQVEYLKDL